MDDRGNTRPGLGVGFGLAGLLSAGLAYAAFNAGLFQGPAWRGSLLAIAIGACSAGLLLWIDRTIARRRFGTPERPALLKGPWACPRCGAAYLPEVSECSDCHVPLVRGERSGRGYRVPDRE